MNKKKTIIAALVLLLLLAIGGVMAYFTDSDTKTNTFTVGNVDIQLNEVWTAADGQGVVPGQEVTKTPTVANIGKSKAYVFLEVSIPCHNSKPLFTLVGENTTDWSLVGTAGACDAAEGKAVSVYSYGTLTELAKDAETPALFTKVKLDKDLTSDDATALKDKDLNVVVNAYGIQVDGLDVSAPADVWALAK